MMIDLQHLFYRYSDQSEALKDVSLRIEPGEAVAFIGPNGSGKSTLMKLIGGLITAEKGQYLLNGEAVTAKKLKDRRFAQQLHKHIGLIFQNPDTQLFCGSVKEEIAFGPDQMGLTEDQVNIRVADSMRLLGISGLAERPPYHLSEGEKKRVAIAAVVALNPQVYIFDEPMNHLDPKSKRFLRQFMIKLNQLGKTLICSTHDFACVEGIFRRAAVFSEDHRLIRCDDYESVMRDREFLLDHNII